MKRRIAISAGILLALCLLAAVAAGVVLTEVAMRSTRTHMAAAHRTVIFERVRLHQATLTDVSIVADDGTVLRGWHVEPRQPNGETVALFHGVADTRAGVAGYGELFLEHGYGILLPDSRAHGESGGSIATYGVREADDIAQWARWLRNRHAGCVYGFGESMGAGLVLQSLRANAPFCAVVAESGFSDFRHAAYDRIASRTGVPPTLTRVLAALPVEIGFLYARLRYGVDFNQASAVKAVQTSTVPVLLIHGTADQNLLPENSFRIQAARSSGVDLWSVPNAAHCGAWAATGEVFHNRILSFFRQVKGASRAAGAP